MARLLKIATIGAWLFSAVFRMYQSNPLLGKYREFLEKIYKAKTPEDLDSINQEFYDCFTAYQKKHPLNDDNHVAPNLSKNKFNLSLWQMLLLNLKFRNLHLDKEPTDLKKRYIEVYDEDNKFLRDNEYDFAKDYQSGDIVYKRLYILTEIISLHCFMNLAAIEPDKLTQRWQTFESCVWRCHRYLLDYYEDCSLQTRCNTTGNPFNYEDEETIELVKNTKAHLFDGNTSAKEDLTGIDWETNFIHKLYSQVLFWGMTQTEQSTWLCTKLSESLTLENPSEARIDEFHQKLKDFAKKFEQARLKVLANGHSEQKLINIFNKLYQEFILFYAAVRIQVTDLIDIDEPDERDLNQVSLNVKIPTNLNGLLNQCRQLNISFQKINEIYLENVFNLTNDIYDRDPTIGRFLESPDEQDICLDSALWYMCSELAYLRGAYNDNKIKNAINAISDAIKSNVFPKFKDPLLLTLMTYLMNVMFAVTGLRYENEELTKEYLANAKKHKNTELTNNYPNFLLSIDQYFIKSIEGYLSENTENQKLEIFQKLKLDFETAIKDENSNIWSLGCLLSEMLNLFNTLETIFKPFNLPKNSLVTTYRQYLNEFQSKLSRKELNTSKDEFQVLSQNTTPESTITKSERAHQQLSYVIGLAMQIVALHRKIQIDANELEMSDANNDQQEIELLCLAISIQSFLNLTSAFKRECSYQHHQNHLAFDLVYKRLYVLVSLMELHAETLQLKHGDQPKQLDELLIHKLWGCKILLLDYIEFCTYVAKDNIQILKIIITECREIARLSADQLHNGNFSDDNPCEITKENQFIRSLYNQALAIAREYPAPPDCTYSILVKNLDLPKPVKKAKRSELKKCLEKLQNKFNELLQRITPILVLNIYKSYLSEPQANKLSSVTAEWLRDFFQAFQELLIFKTELFIALAPSIRFDKQGKVKFDEDAEAIHGDCSELVCQYTLLEDQLFWKLGFHTLQFESVPSITALIKTPEDKFDNFYIQRSRLFEKWDDIPLFNTITDTTGFEDFLNSQIEELNDTYIQNFSSPELKAQLLLELYMLAIFYALQPPNQDETAKILIKKAQNLIQHNDFKTYEQNQAYFQDVLLPCLARLVATQETQDSQTHKNNIYFLIHTNNDYRKNMSQAVKLNGRWLCHTADFICNLLNSDNYPKLTKIQIDIITMSVNTIYDQYFQTASPNESPARNGKTNQAKKKKKKKKKNKNKSSKNVSSPAPNIATADQKPCQSVTYSKEFITYQNQVLTEAEQPTIREATINTTKEALPKEALPNKAKLIYVPYRLHIDLPNSITRCIHLLTTINSVEFAKYYTVLWGDVVLAALMQQTIQTVRFQSKTYAPIADVKKWLNLNVEYLEIQNISELSSNTLLVDFGEHQLEITPLVADVEQALTNKIPAQEALVLAQSQIYLNAQALFWIPGCLIDTRQTLQPREHGQTHINLNYSQDSQITHEELLSIIEYTIRFPTLNLQNPEWIAQCKSSLKPCDKTQANRVFQGLQRLFTSGFAVKAINMITEYSLLEELFPSLANEFYKNDSLRTAIAHTFEFVDETIHDLQQGAPELIAQHFDHLMMCIVSSLIFDGCQRELKLEQDIDILNTLDEPNTQTAIQDFLAKNSIVLAETQMNILMTIWGNYAKIIQQKNDCALALTKLDEAEALEKPYTHIYSQSSPNWLFFHNQSNYYHRLELTELSSELCLWDIHNITTAYLSEVFQEFYANNMNTSNTFRCKI